MSLPLVPPVSQFDGGPHASENCTCASGARLLRYVTGKRATGSEVRRMQSDQIGGTSIPDVMHALHNGWSFEPVWASPTDGVHVPANHVGSYIGTARLKALLADRYMVMVQGDYGDLSPEYREQVNFRGDHCFTVDAYRKSPAAYYVVDTIPGPHSGYDGRWIPEVELNHYAFGIAGLGRIWAAWGRHIVPPDTSTGDVMGPQGIPQHPSIAESKGATLYETYDPATGKLSGKSYAVPAGDTKRLVTTYGDHDVLGIGHDRSPDVSGKSILYSPANQWNVAVLP